MSMDNQRRSFRIDVEVGFQIEVVTEDEMRSGIADLKTRPDWDATLLNGLNEIDVHIMAAIEDLRATAPRAANLIDLLNKKVDMLRAGQALGERVQELPLRQVNLSATGLAFEEQEPMAVGAPLHGMLTLPSIGWTMEIYARVVSVRLVENGMHKVCLDYEFIRNEDTEQLIRFNLQQQQQLLNEKLNS